MEHLIDTRSFTIDEIEDLYLLAYKYKSGEYDRTLANKMIITIFFENSTRTRSSFEIAAKNLGANVVSLDIATSSSNKGETLYDTAANLDAMHPDAIIVRHKNAGVPSLLSKYVNCPILNAGDGAYAHPTQALLDMFTIREFLGDDLKGKKIAMVGDIKNSRVANSNIELLSRFGLDITLVAPPHFLPPHTTLKTSHDIKEVISDMDIVMSLRTQTERHTTQIYASLKDYGSDFCITKKLVADRDIILLHPGPVHRNIDIDDEMLADVRSKVLNQVSNGVFIRMAVLEMLINS
ncbi:MAG TPA: aspartate carbamoyltransferase catalytic subunit [Campylobacterales bacterium]|nr:aspartate carbamoyltransferase catalytic subunit [Campylobacterales bacterium]